MCLEQSCRQSVELGRRRRRGCLEREPQLAAEDMAQQLQRVIGQRHAGTTRRTLCAAFDEAERDERFGYATTHTAIEERLEPFEREQLEKEGGRDEGTPPRGQGS